MHYSKEELQNLDKVKRLNIINSVSGVKPANLIGTISSDGATNLAIFSSVVHLGSNPGLLGMILRPAQDVRRHTYENIMETGYYTINHVQRSFAENAHFTSVKFEKDESEFEKCGLTEAFLFDFPAPFVAESQVKIGLKFLEEISIPVNGTSMLIGEILHIEIFDNAINDLGYIDLSLMDHVGVSGLNTYYSLSKVDSFPYARRSNLPDFTKKDR
ncbi:flavin reductase family protein [Dyadobacter tibetensis]|uniref:flavin reductase family protein n=1 Tax=Dyadobacter tibetensis TaxID=1211851 RepID=UPI00046E7551|nr:flavin reductase [Dyadobacter tibetensis]